MALFNLSKSTWATITAIPIMIGVITGIWKIDDRYAKADDLNKTKEVVEQQTVRTFEVFQKKQDTINDGLRLDLLNIVYERTKDELSELRREFKNNPDNSDLELKVDETKKKIENIRTKINELRDKLMGVD